jgi:hypothetical protein
MTILLTHASQRLETGTTRRQQDPTADSLTDPKRTSHLSRTSRNRADLCREVKETTKQVTQEWVDGQQTRYREFQHKLLRTGRSHGTVSSAVLLRTLLRASKHRTAGRTRSSLGLCIRENGREADQKPDVTNVTDRATNEAFRNERT